MLTFQEEHKGERASSKGDNVRGMSAVKWLKRDKIIQIRWFGSSKDFVSKRKYRKYLIVYSFFNFEPGVGRI